jgi:two-component system response regulator FixJ
MATMNKTDDQLVYIVDDDDGVRESLAALLQSVGIVSRGFDSAEALLEALLSECPACMLVDVRMPGMSGLELQQHLAEKELAVPLVMMTGHGDVPMAVQAMKNGAKDFLEKPFNEQALIELVQRCTAQGMAAGQRRASKNQIRYRLQHLTEREREVMGYLVDGKSSKQIAALLELSPKTVDVHRYNIMHKANVNSIAELVRMSLEVDSDSPV